MNETQQQPQNPNLSLSHIIGDKFAASSGILQPTVRKCCQNEYNIYEELLLNESNGMEDYTAPLWQKKTWKVPHGLCGPLASSKDDNQLTRFYEALQHTLYETGLPETIDLTGVSKKQSCDQVTIGILSSPVECMSNLLAGGELCPGDMLLIMSDTWCSKQTSPILPNKYSLYVHQAVTFYEGGYSFLERYDPPRRVTYFVNYFTDACTGGVCCEGEKLEKGLDCPMSSSLKLNQIVDDKLYTRILLGKAGVGYPVTLAFRYKAIGSYENENEISNITVVRIDDGACHSASKNLVRNAISKFITENKNSAYNKLVVKPSGVSWYGSKCVSFHNKMDVDGITAAVQNVFEHLQEGDSVLVEEYIQFEQPKHQNHDIGKYNVRIRSNVVRNSSGNSQTTQITCGIGISDQPINGDNTIPHSLELLLKKFGFSDIQIREIRQDIALQSEKCMAAIIQSEAGLSEEKRGEVGAQTDLIGIDLILKKTEEAKYEVVVLEINSHDCMINCQIYEFINRNKLHEAAADLVETMIARSNAFLIKGKTLLVIGVGDFSKWFAFEEANRHGVNVVLVDTDFDNSMPSVPVFVEHDLSNLKNIEKIASDIIRKLHSKKIYPDGCISFWEDYAPIAAAICEKLKLVGSNFRAATIAKNKFLTHQILSKRMGDIPHFPRTYLYSSKTHQIDSDADIQKAVSEKTISLPAVLKLLYGSSAVGVHLVKTEEECKQYFNEIQEKLDMHGVGLGFGSSMMLTNFIAGSEHDVDLIIFNRKLVAAFVSDNGPTRVPDFTETVAVMPSTLDEESKSQLITTAYQCCLEIGLENGVFNIELMMTKTGPKLLEINARMGGYYLRDWILQCYGVDILLSAMMISFGIRPHIRAKKPTRSIVGVMCLPSEHGDILSDREVLKRLKEKQDNGSIRFSKFDFPIANIAAIGPDATTAMKALIDLCDTFRISTPSYNVEKMLSFVPS